MKQYLLTSLFLASAALAWAVPSEINYQGRLTDANGDPVTGEVSMSLKMFDAATDGNELYSEDLGTVTLDDNGVYSFQFGASGQSVVDREETIAITDGSSTTFSNTLGSVPLDETLVVADGTYSWNVVDGNPGEQATATAVLANGFVIGVTVTNGGEGYVEPPVVTIEGLGSGATATAVVEDGAITAINVNATGSGYASATVTIAEPPAPYVVNYDAGTVSVTYETAPSAGTEILATYEANDSSIAGALAGAFSHWLELTVDGQVQTPRERILSVPFAQVAGSLSDADFLMDVMYSEYRVDQSHSSLPYGTQDGQTIKTMVIDILPVAGVKTIETIKVPFKAENRLSSPPSSLPPSSLNIRLVSRDRLGRNNDLFNADFTTSGADADDIVTLEAIVNLPVDFSNRTYRLILKPTADSSTYYGDYDRDNVVVYPINIQFSK